MEQLKSDLFTLYSLIKTKTKSLSSQGKRYLCPYSEGPTLYEITKNPGSGILNLFHQHAGTFTRSFA